MWTTINNIAFVTKLAGFEYTKYIAENISTSEGVPLFKGKNILNGEIVYKFEAYIPLDISNELFRSQITKRCLLTPYVGTIGNIGIHDKEGVYHLGSNVGKIELFNNDNLNIYEEFVKNYLLSSFGYKELTKQKKATAQESISIEAIREVLLPLPPLAEQKRIVAEIERWFVLVDQIEQGKVDLQTTIKQAKSKILDLAIHGKLVPQDPSDEPATELLKRINPKTEITCDNGQYGKIPKGWVMCPIGDLFDVVSAKRVLKSDWTNKGIPFYRAREIVQLHKEGFADKDLFITEQLFAELKDKFGIPNAGDIMLSAVGSIGYTYIVNENDSFYYKDASVLCLKNVNQLNSLYFSMLFETTFVKEQMYDNSKGTTVDTITIEKLRKYFVPLPPLAEQHRIVAKIEELFSKLDQIEKSLEA